MLTTATLKRLQYNITHYNDKICSKCESYKPRECFLVIKTEMEMGICTDCKDKYKQNKKV